MKCLNQCKIGLVEKGELEKSDQWAYFIVTSFTINESLLNEIQCGSKLEIVKLYETFIFIIFIFIRIIQY